MAEPFDTACDHTFTTTYVRNQRLIKACRCGFVVSTDFTVPEPPINFDDIIWKSTEEQHA